MQSTKWRKNVQSQLHALRADGICVMIEKKIKWGFIWKVQR